MDLSDRQKDQYYKQGYCVLRKLIPREMTQRAVRAINHSLGAEGMDKDALPSLRAQTYCRELTQTATITDLVNATDLASAVESLVGAGNLMPTSRGQPPVDLPHGPIQIRGRAGDVCLAHHQLIHCAAPNGSPHIRYAAIFRLGHVNCSENGVKSMTDIWMEYPGPALHTACIARSTQRLRHWGLPPSGRVDESFA